MTTVLLHEFEKEAKSKLRKRISKEQERIRRSAKESLVYGVSGAVTAPALRKLYWAVERKGGPVKSRRHYRLGKHKIPSWVPASAATGFVGAGVIPYIQDILREKRQRRLEKRGTGSRLFMPPQARGKFRAVIPEDTKAYPRSLLKATNSVAKMSPGEFRA